MCGIVAAIAQRDVTPILLEGLKRLEYRGYDSAGVAVVDNGALQLARAVGKVAALQDTLNNTAVRGALGIAHTRWATHGEVSERNAHPHVSSQRVAVVHNGIIENYATIREMLVAEGYVFVSETDSETIAHLIDFELRRCPSLLAAVQAAVAQFKGAYGLAVMALDTPDELVVARSGSPLVLGLGIGENFVASDVAALVPVTQRVVFLQEGDVAQLSRETWQVFDAQGEAVERVVHEASQSDVADRGGYRHYMLKEIFEQPRALADTLQERISHDALLPQSLGPAAEKLLATAENVHIVACGTSYHAGMVARYWIETLAGVPVNVELASEYRYRDVVVPSNTLFVTLSQSGETADTLAALHFAKSAGYLATLTICNSAQSSMVRESDLAMMTRAGPEIGVASTKAFTTQLISLLLIAGMLGKLRGRLTSAREAELVSHLSKAPGLVEDALKMDKAIQALSEDFADKQHALFLGRGTQFPIAMEGALKLKEISYIHAEAYAAGELKHGPLALIDEDMPTIVVAPNNDLLDKLKSNLEVVRARGGQLYVFADADTGIRSEPAIRVTAVPHMDDLIAPVVYTIPLQLLAYHVAILKGTDVDQPRNLAKSVTVE
ncbi:glucosamine/fructose-6-phosphate aminotransferase [Oceanococcus atlanticus]|uniref:Glutamine--fructose-6-phosphate aminotransferase [isomerizing] n=1 Tax=Oceanococcus atlanticus TaxID=1317117 RepID=A0A1Y1SB95_9GAMM|nr:glutamine--fructose-6-phosphate transaminase (isomerizing) [Oceanococcus atlanticus]ORE85414.1 glucosamine/fructose-6-phosphate aminotransferase [Oceanococcus atlanticus]